MNLVTELASVVVQRSPGTRLLVAIDGVDCSGKTTLADLLGEAVRPHRPVVRASIDAFHRPRADRYRRGRESPEGCYHDTFDVDSLRDQLLEPFAVGAACRTAVFDLRADIPVSPPPEAPAPDAVLLLDGVFLQRPALRSRWDVVLHLQVPDSEVLRRAAARDGTDALPLYRTRYLPAQRLYEAECAPAERADVVIDNRDPARPVVLRGWPPPAVADGTLTP